MTEFWVALVCLVVVAVLLITTSRQPAAVSSQQRRRKSVEPVDDWPQPGPKAKND